MAEREARRQPDVVVTVVVPVRNGAGTVGQQLEALAEQDFGGCWEVLVVDNGSTDGTLGEVMAFESRLPALRVLHADDRVGSSHARNIAMTAARAELVAFCDADDQVDRGWLTALVGAARHADVVGGRLEYDLLNDADTLARRPEPPMTSLAPSGGFLPRAIGANLALRRTAWLACGGFDESYRHGGTETELQWRLQLAGHSVAFAPDAVVHYRFRRGCRSMFGQFTRFGRAQAHLYRDFRRAGMRRPSPFGFGRAAVWLVCHMGDLARGPERQGRWIRVAAVRWGRLLGSVRHRVVYL